jgi:hypothetical protein
VLAMLSSALVAMPRLPRFSVRPLGWPSRRGGGGCACWRQLAVSRWRLRRTCSIMRSR